MLSSGVVLRGRARRCGECGERSGGLGAIYAFNAGTLSLALRCALSATRPLLRRATFNRNEKSERLLARFRLDVRSRFRLWLLRRRCLGLRRGRYCFDAAQRVDANRVDEVELQAAVDRAIADHAHDLA